MDGAMAFARSRDGREAFCSKLRLSASARHTAGCMIAPIRMPASEPFSSLAKTRCLVFRPSRPQQQFKTCWIPSVTLVRNAEADRHCRAPVISNNRPPALNAGEALACLEPDVVQIQLLRRENMNEMRELTDMEVEAVAG